MAVWSGIAKRQIAAGIAVLLWATFLYSGIKISFGAASQGMNGLPSHKQLALYILIPRRHGVVWTDPCFLGQEDTLVGIPHRLLRFDRGSTASVFSLWRWCVRARVNWFAGRATDDLWTALGPPVPPRAMQARGAPCCRVLTLRAVALLNAVHRRGGHLNITQEVYAQSACGRLFVRAARAPHKPRYVQVPVRVGRRRPPRLSLRGLFDPPAHPHASLSRCMLPSRPQGGSHKRRADARRLAG